MKITLIQDFLRSGGTERQSILLANACAAAGHTTTLVTFRPGGALAGTVAPGVARRILQPFDLTLDWFAPGLAATARELAPDIVLCMGRMANCYAGRLQATLPRSAVIATMRTGKPLPSLFRQSLQKVRHVVANSRDARDTLVRRYAVPTDKVTVIHNSLVFPSTPANSSAADGGAVPSPRGLLRQQHKAAPTTAVLLCVAMFRPEKNQRELVEIVAGLPTALDYQLWLGGDGPARAACEALVAERGLGARVKFLGFHRDPSPLYQAADVAVHASWSEALSNFLIEAQAHGLPAIAYAAQGIDECFVPGQTGWVIPRDNREAFRTTLTALLAQPAAARASLAAAAREYARTTFDPARNVQAYLNVFAALTRKS
ncbi:MAG: glycosyltransferase [Verrucomicrobiota bacterium]